MGTDGVATDPFTREETRHVRPRHTATLRPGAGGGDGRLATEQRIPALRQSPGFRHYSGTADRARPGGGYVTIVWDTEDQVNRVRDVFGGLIPRFQALGL